MLDKLTLASFEPYQNQLFKLQLDDENTMDLELIEMAHVGRNPADYGEAERRWSFSLILLGPPDPILEQQVVSLQHDDLGQLDLFLVPVGSHHQREGMQYEVIFT